MPTNGNAGAAWATYAARAGLDALIAMPADAPSITRAECAVAGAGLYLVNGLIGDAGRLVAEKIAAEPGVWMDAATLKEPYRIEGRKTMGWRSPNSSAGAPRTSSSTPPAAASASSASTRPCSNCAPWGGCRGRCPRW